MSKQSLLLVDGDTRSLRVLEVSLRKAGFTVTPAASVQDALDKLELHAPDLIISETTFTDGDGFELRRRVRATPEWAEIPFIFLTAEAAIENKIRGLELGVDDYLTKPIYIKEIVTRINILLQKRQRLRFEERKDGRTRFAGRVADMPVVDVIQTIEISRKSGVIQFVGERGRQAAIYFRDGKVIDAEAGTLQGEDAVYRLLTWSEGEFEVVFRTVRRREVITASSQGLLMEGMRRLDEWSRLLEQLPPLTHRFEIDTAELAGRLGDVPDDNNQILRLIDGKRTLLEVIDASDFGDLECLQAIGRLFFEEMLVDVDQHAAPKRRETGKPIPLVEVNDEESGPHDAPAARVSDSSILAEHMEAAEPVLPDEPELHAPLMGGYRPSSLRLIDEAVAAAQAIEPSLFDDDPRPAATPGRVSAEIPISELDAIDTPRSLPPPPPRSRSGTAPPPLPPPRLRPPIDVSEFAIEESTTLGGSQDSVPHEIVKDDPSPPTQPMPRRKATMPPPIPLKPPAPLSSLAPPSTPLPRNEDSGLRMIGSLGRDRAEASGEVVPLGMAAAPVSETQRELVTILPRRITREMKALPAVTPSESSLAAPAPPVEPPAPRSSSPRLAGSEGSGVTRNEGGPGAGAMALIILAAVLAGTAVFLWLKRPAKPDHVAIISSDLIDAGTALTPTDDASATAPIDAPESAFGVDAAVPVAIDAAVTPQPADASESTVADPSAQAKKLSTQASAAIQEGDFARALELADESLKTRRSVRGHLVRAQALQRLGKINEALAAVDAAEKMQPDSASVWDVRGSILWAARRWDDAHDAYNRFLELEQDSRRADQIRRRLEEPH